jgi:hypothetical protein
MNGKGSGMVHGMAMVWSSPCFDHFLEVHGLAQGVKKYSNDHNSSLVY